MDNSTISPSFADLQKTLTPYVKSRQEVSRIRRLLAIHLHSQLGYNSSTEVYGPLALIDEPKESNITYGGVRGSRREYLKALRLHIKARQEYEKLSQVVSNKNEVKTQESDGLQDFVTLVKQRQRVERLRILQDHVNNLSRKSSSGWSNIKPPHLGSSAISPAPIEILRTTDAGSEDSTVGSLEDLLQKLEKSVLLAKGVLLEEKRMLSEAKHRIAEPRLDSDQKCGKVLHALSQARNELIAWVEDELSKTAVSPAAVSSEAESLISGSEKRVETLLSEIRAQYIFYLKMREDIIEIASLSLSSELHPETRNTTSSPEKPTINAQGDFEAKTIGPLLQKLSSLSNEHKSILQHRSNMMISLAKQHKDTIQMFNRLADESHLLPTYSTSLSGSSRGKLHRQAAFLEDEIANKETPSASHLARAWTVASRSASSATKETVLGSVDQGRIGIEESRKAVSALNLLLGKGVSNVTPEGVKRNEADGEDLRMSERVSRDYDFGGNLQPNADSNIWDILDGGLGTIWISDTEENECIQSHY